MRSSEGELVGAEVDDAVDAVALGQEIAGDRAQE